MKCSGFLCLATIIVVSNACSRREAEKPAAVISTAAPSASVAPRATSLAEMLPDKAGPFDASPLVNGPQFVRREYSQGPTKISVTIANAGATPMTFEDWVKMSATSPAVQLDAPENSAFGFYDCAGSGADAPCNVHIHFRAGYHLELMGEGKAKRVDFDSLLKNLPIRRLAQRVP